MEERDYYEILGVSPRAEPEAIEGAARRLKAKYAPDRVGQWGVEEILDTPSYADSVAEAKKLASEKGIPLSTALEEVFEERFKEINNAAEVLRDPEERHRYDREIVTDRDILWLDNVAVGEVVLASFSITSVGVLVELLDLNWTPPDAWLRVSDWDDQSFPIPVIVEVDTRALEANQRYEGHVSIYIDVNGMKHHLAKQVLVRLETGQAAQPDVKPKATAPPKPEVTVNVPPLSEVLEPVLAVSLSWQVKLGLLIVAGLMGVVMVFQGSLAYVGLGLLILGGVVYSGVETNWLRDFEVSKTMAKGVWVISIVGGVFAGILLLPSIAVVSLALIGIVLVLMGLVRSE